VLKVGRPGFGFLAESSQKTLKVSIHSVERWNKNLQGGRGQRKKDRKIALLSLYLLYRYHVWNPLVGRQVRLLCPWARHLTGLLLLLFECLDYMVVTVTASFYNRKALIAIPWLTYLDK